MRDAIATGLCLGRIPRDAVFGLGLCTRPRECRHQHSRGDRNIQ